MRWFGVIIVALRIPSNMLCKIRKKPVIKVRIILPNILIFFLNIIIPSEAVLFRMGETTLEDSTIADAMFVMMSLPVYSVKSKGIT